MIKSLTTTATFSKDTARHPTCAMLHQTPFLPSNDWEYHYGPCTKMKTRKKHMSYQVVLTLVVGWFLETRHIYALPSWLCHGSQKHQVVAFFHDSTFVFVKKCKITKFHQLTYNFICGLISPFIDFRH